MFRVTPSSRRQVLHAAEQAPHGAPARYRYGRRPAGLIICQTYSPWRQGEPLKFVWRHGEYVWHVIRPAGRRPYLYLAGAP